MRHKIELLEAQYFFLRGIFNLCYYNNTLVEKHLFRSLKESSTGLISIVIEK